MFMFTPTLTSSVMETGCGGRVGRWAGGGGGGEGGRVVGGGGGGGEMTLMVPARATTLPATNGKHYGAARY